MALFGKKKKNENPDVVENAQVVDSANGKGKKKSKKKNGMAQVLNESVPATIETELMANEPFIYEKNGVKKYVGVLLKVADIGGLDKKARKVEAKGALIEAINSGNLKAIVTEELMEKEELVFIPDSQTALQMLDFSLLQMNSDTGEPIRYQLMYVNASGATNRIEITPVEPERFVDFNELSAFVTDEDGDLEEFLGMEPDDLDEDDDYGLGTGSDEDEEGASDVPDVDDIDAVDDIDDIPNIDDDIDEIPDMNESVPEPEDTYFDDTMDNGAMGMDEGYEEQSVQQQPEEHEVPNEWMQDAVTRKFYSDELGLEITTEPFDAQFLQNNGFAAFDENRPSGWLNDQLNEMARQANLELARMHKDNLFLIRERYFKLISRHADRIQQDLDITNPRTTYGKVFASLEEARRNEMAQIESRVARKKEDLEAAWKRKLQEVGQDAARSAQRQYRERYGKQHETEIYQLSDIVKSAIEGDYHDAVHEIQSRRRMEAAKLLDLGITEVLDEISDQYMTVLADENARYRELEENMRAFVDDNRSNDIARTNALAEELRQKDKAREVLEEQTMRIKSMRGEWDSERQRLLNDIENMRGDNQRHLAEVQAHSDELLARERQRVEELEKQIEKLQVQNEKMYETAKQEYSHQLEEKQNEIAALHDRQAEAMEQHKRTQKTVSWLVVAIAIAAIGIGFILGTYIRLDHKVQDAQNRIVQEYEEPQANEKADK